MVASSTPTKTRSFALAVVLIVSLASLITLSTTTRSAATSYLDWTKNPAVVEEAVAAVPEPTRLSCPNITVPTPPPVQVLVSPPEPACVPDARIEKEYGRWNVRRSRVHEGSGYRLSKVWEKAARGETIEVAVLGGSVSTGHGAKNGQRFVYGAIKEIWHHFVVDWLKEVLGEDHVRFRNGANPAVDSGYFWWCFTEHIGTSADIVLLENAVNDNYGDADLMKAENLLRSILQLPNAPAVIYVDSFAQRSEGKAAGMLNGGDAHAPLAAFYDVSQISARGPLLPAMIANHSLEPPYFGGDPRHIAAPLHRFLGKMVVSLLQESRCESINSIDPSASIEEQEEEPSFDDANGLWPHEGMLGDVPQIKMTDRWDSETTYPVVPPSCSLAGSKLTPSRPSPAWTLFDWKKEKFYLETKSPNAPIYFSVDLPADSVGEVAIAYFRSKSYDLGKLSCTVEGQSITVDGHWPKGASVPQYEIVARGLAPGKHEMECRTPKGSRKLFRIVGVMSR